MNRYPWWKNLTLIIVFLIAVIYAMPILFGNQPAIQISSSSAGIPVPQSVLTQIKSTLKTQHISYVSAELKNKNVLLRFVDTDTQLQAKGAIKSALGDQYIVALNLESATPTWLTSIGAYPMKLGLDLQGGVHLLLQVDTDSVVARQEKSDVRNIGQELRSKKIRYTGIAPQHSGGIGVRFRSADDMNQAKNILQTAFNDFLWQPLVQADSYQLMGQLLPASLVKIKQNTIEQTMTNLRRRVNELGVSEAVVQQSGKNRISVDLPGIQDAAEAQNILGKVANVEFHLQDTKNDAGDAVGGLTPAGDELFTYEGTPVLLYDRIVLSGESITNASASFDQNGRPAVNIQLGGGGEALFSRITGENVGQPMGVVYIETKSHVIKLPGGKTKIVYKEERRVINIATIQSALGNSFQIMGLSSPIEARNLALLLKAGALPAPMTIIQEQTIGPSMGRANIHMGMTSLLVGLALILVFMMLYYEVFGVVANLGLLINLVLLLAVLSALGATLTFPGIAGLVLTIGMAVDYNVLIYERIREELRNGVTPQIAIHTGYDKAFVTIVDANLVSLIVALILFALGSGPVKGFAIVLTLGLVTSIISSVTYSRALVNWFYGGRKLTRILIGIKVKQKQSKNLFKSANEE